jgi:hypothetical protein
METLLIGFGAVILAAVVLKLIALAYKVMMVVGLAAVIVGVWFYPAQAYVVAQTIGRTALQLAERAVG